MEDKKLKNFGIITEKEYLGKTQQEATELAKNNGFIVRIVERDGSPFMVTADYKTDRINFRINNNIVVGASGG